MNKKIILGTILVLLISTFALGCIGGRQQPTPAPTETPAITPLGTTEQVTPLETIVPTMPTPTEVSTVAPTTTGNATANLTTPASVAVDIKNYAYSPLTVTVPQGTTVTWTNDDTVGHTVTSVTGLFDSGRITPGMTYSYTFNQSGTFGYSCTIHPNITQGTVTVTSSGMSTPTSTTSTYTTYTPTPTATDTTNTTMPTPTMPTPTSTATTNTT